MAELVIGVASLVAAISFIMFPLALIAALMGLIIGIVTLTRRRHSGATNTGQAIAGVACSAIVQIVRHGAYGCGDRMGSRT